MRPQVRYQGHSVGPARTTSTRTTASTLTRFSWRNRTTNHRVPAPATTAPMVWRAVMVPAWDAWILTRFNTLEMAMPNETVGVATMRSSAGILRFFGSSHLQPRPEANVTATTVA